MTPTTKASCIEALGDLLLIWQERYRSATRPEIKSRCADKVEQVLTALAEVRGYKP